MKRHNVILALSVVLLPILPFSLILSVPLPGQVELVLRKGNSFVPFLGAIVLLLFITFQRQGWFGHLYRLTILAILYGLGLSFYWNTAFVPDVFEIFGFLPITDASNYYSAACALLGGLKIGWAQASYRPLFPLFLSSLLALSKLDPKVVLAILVYLNLLGGYLAAHEIQKTHGALAASFYLMFGYLFYRFFMGMFMSEQLGFLLGNLAIALIWNGIRGHKMLNILLGIFCMSYGLNVRPAGMVVLPMLALWSGFCSSQRRAFSLKWSGFALIAALLGFLLNYYVAHEYLLNPGRTFSNWGYQLYGVAAGNAGWQQLTLDYPGTPPEEALDRAIQKIIQNPKLFAKGVLLTYRDYFEPAGENNLFAFLRHVSNPMKWFLWIWSLGGVVYLLFSRRDRYSAFLLFSFIGISLSIPFAPPRDGGWRLYTVTDPLVLGLLVNIFPWLKRILSSNIEKSFRLKLAILPNQQNRVEAEHPGLSFLSLVLLISVLIFNLFVPWLQVPSGKVIYTYPEDYCPEGDILIGFWTNRNGWIQIVPEAVLPKGMFLPYMTTIRMKEHVLKSEYFTAIGFDTLLPYIVPGSSLGVLPYNYFASGQIPEINQVFVVANTNSLPEEHGFVVLCGNLLPVDSPLKVKIFVARDYQNPETISSVQVMPPTTQRFVFNGMFLVILLISTEGIWYGLRSIGVDQRIGKIAVELKRFFDRLLTE